LIPKVAAYNQLILIPVLLLLIFNWNKMPSLGLVGRSASKAVIVCQLWQWSVAFVLATASPLIPVHTVRSASALPLATLLALPAVAVAAVLLITCRPAGGECA